MSSGPSCRVYDGRPALTSIRLAFNKSELWPGCRIHKDCRSKPHIPFRCAIAKKIKALRRVSIQEKRTKIYVCVWLSRLTQRRGTYIRFRHTVPRNWWNRHSKKRFQLNSSFSFLFLVFPLAHGSSWNRQIIKSQSLVFFRAGTHARRWAYLDERNAS